MSSPAVQISQIHHALLKKIVRKRRSRGDRANNGFVVEQLIAAEAKKEKIKISTIRQHNTQEIEE